MKTFVVDIDAAAKKFIACHLDAIEMDILSISDIADELTDISQHVHKLACPSTDINTFRNLLSDGFTMMMLPADVFREIENYVCPPEDACNIKFALIVTRNDEMIGVIDGKYITW